MVCREIVNTSSATTKTKNKIRKDKKMANTENRDSFIRKFHDVEFGAAIFACTKVQAGLARVFSRAERKAFNRIINRGSKDDIEDLLVAYRLIGGKVASESRKRLTFLLYGEVKNETKNGKVTHYIKHVPDKEIKSAKADKGSLMARVKLLSENFSYVINTTDKVEAMVKAYEKLSEEDQLAFIRKLYGLID